MLLKWRRRKSVTQKKIFTRNLGVSHPRKQKAGVNFSSYIIISTHPNLITWYLTEILKNPSSDHVDKVKEEEMGDDDDDSEEELNKKSADKVQSFQLIIRLSHLKRLVSITLLINSFFKFVLP